MSLVMASYCDEWNLTVRIVWGRAAISAHLDRSRYCHANTPASDRSGDLAEPARLVRVTLHETDRNSVVYEGEEVSR